MLFKPNRSCQNYSLFRHIHFVIQTKASRSPWSTQKLLSLQMISNKTLFALALFVLNVVFTASASGTDTPGQLTLAKKQGSKKKSTLLLQDTTSTVETVQAEESSVQSVP